MSPAERIGAAPGARAPAAGSCRGRPRTQMRDARPGRPAAAQPSGGDGGDDGGGALQGRRSVPCDDPGAPRLPETDPLGAAAASATA